jgi:tRNA modification GTPase
MQFDKSVICAISTAAGTGAIAIIRVEGKGSIELVANLLKSTTPLTQAKGNTIHFGRLVDGDRTIDEVLASVFRDPHSYTGNDTVEISCHGSVYIQQQVLQLFIKKGARLAEPGEFTKRAFLNGKLDLSQAEAVADLIASESESAHKLAIEQIRGGFSKDLSKLRDGLLHFISMIELELDFSEEEVEFADRKQLAQLINDINTHLQGLTQSFQYGNVLKNGVPVAIVGPPNAGKSTLLNALLNEEKAIVSEIAGTTRDVIEDQISINGIRFRFMDTAGIRTTNDTIESLGIERTYERMSQARIIIMMADATQPVSVLTEQLKSFTPAQNQQLAVIVNKCDKTSYDEAKHNFASTEKQYPVFYLSAKQREHIDLLIQFLTQNVSNKNTSSIVVSNIRHYEALSLALEAGKRVSDGLTQHISGDFIAQDIREMLYFIGTITGEISTDEILGNIFKNFCIGK